MSTAGPPIRKPGPASAGERYALFDDALRRPSAKLCFVLPLGVTILVLFVAYAFAPRIDAGNAGDFSSLFSTAAGLIVTLLVALAIELRSLREANTQRLIVGGTLSYVAIGAVAAVVALNPTLGPDAYRVLFALTMAAGTGALLSTLLIALQGFKAEVKQQRKEKTRRGGRATGA